jgi:hypothetical protein
MSFDVNIFLRDLACSADKAGQHFQLKPEIVIKFVDYEKKLPASVCDSEN